MDRTATTPRVPRGAWLLVLLVGLTLFELVRWAVQSTGNENLVPSLLLLGATVVPLSFATFLCGLPHTFEVSGMALVVMAVVGGTLGVVASGIVEYDALHGAGPWPMIGIALIEETAKLLGPALALLVVRPVRATTGLILGVACGAGFAVLETLGYSAVALTQSHEHLGAVDDLLFQRGLVSPATHMAWTGLTACALWAAAERGRTRRSVGVFVAALGLAVALHAAWDYWDTLASYLILGAVSLATLTAVVRWIGGHRRPGERPDSPHPGSRRTRGAVRMGA